MCIWNLLNIGSRTISFMENTIVEEFSHLRHHYFQGPFICELKIMQHSCCPCVYSIVPENNLSTHFSSKKKHFLTQTQELWWLTIKLQSKNNTFVIKFLLNQFKAMGALLGNKFHQYSWYELPISSSLYSYGLIFFTLRNQYMTQHIYGSRK